MKTFINVSIILSIGLLSSSCSSILSLNSPTSAKYSQCNSKKLPPKPSQYKAIALNKIASHYPNDRQNKAPNIIGTDPKKLVLETFGLAKKQDSQKQEITVICTESNQVIVLLKQTGLRDDSVAGIRYYVELVPVEKGWRITWAGRQQKCYPQRGHTDWSTELCL